MFIQDKANICPAPLPEQKELSILGEEDKENKPTYYIGLPYKEISGHIYHSTFFC